MSYFVIYKDYLKNRSVIIDHILNFNEAVCFVESAALHFVHSKRGDDYSKFYDKSKSGKWGNVPDGYFICKGKKKNKYSVYCKTLNSGILYSEKQIRKICSFEIVKLPRHLKIKYYQEQEDFEDTDFQYLIDSALAEKLTKFGKIHKELIEKIRLKKDNECEKKKK